MIRIASYGELYAAPVGDAATHDGDVLGEVVS
jgi:hypothetical protein